jgi:hypothetical protein
MSDGTYSVSFTLSIYSPPMTLRGRPMGGPRNPTKTPTTPARLPDAHNRRERGRL